jgi:predicted ribosomally synthesized peptide with SipW-like signal peptide
MHRLLMVLLLVGLIAGQAGMGAAAYFTDAEPNADNTFEASWESLWGYLYPDAGVDKTGTIYNLSSADLDKLNASDDQRYTVQAKWGTSYSDAVYLGFTFPDIPAAATVIQVLITMEWQRGPQVDAARLKVFDGLGSEQIYTLTLPPKNKQDFSETIDVSAFIDTAQEVNNIEVWFQAMGSKGDTTEHDLVEVRANYHL